MVILQVSLLIALIHCESQTCDFKETVIKVITTNASKLREMSFYSCVIENTNVLDETEGMVTDTSSNLRDDLFLPMVDYRAGNNITYIPNSIFETFPHLRIFQISTYSGLKVLKREYFKNAKHLMGIAIVKNDIVQLDENLFDEAPNLINLMLYNNKIITIHRNAFSGLQKLKGIILRGNNIKYLHPKTFSHLTSLDSLNLRSNSCIDKSYDLLSTKFSELETEILEYCPYELYIKFLHATKSSIQNTSTSSTNMKIETVADNAELSTITENPDYNDTESIFS